MRLMNRLLRPLGVRLVPLDAEVLLAAPWRTHREQVAYSTGRCPAALGTGQEEGQ